MLSPKLDDQASSRLLVSMLSYGSPLYLSNTIQSFATTVQGVILAYFTTNKRNLLEIL